MKRHVFVFVEVMLVLLAGCGGAASRKTQMETSVIRFVQMTDPHLGQRDQNVAIAEKVVDAVKKSSRPVDFVVVTGDIIFDGMYEECLDAYKRIFSGWKVPYYPVAGNNDFGLHGRPKTPSKGAKACVDKWKQHIGPLREYADYPGVRVVAVTTEPLIRGLEDGGDLMAWLEKVLGEAKQKKLDVIVFTHSPIVGSTRNGKFYSPYPEEIYGQLKALLNKYQVKAVVAGHFHVSGLYACGDVPVYVSAASQRGGSMEGYYRVYEYDPKTDRLTYGTVTVR